MEKYHLGYNESKDFLVKLKKLFEEGKFFELFLRGVGFIKKKLVREKIFYFIFRLIKKGLKFEFKEKKLNYFSDRRTFYNERLVELPIFIDILGENKGKKILEVGNVLSNFIKTKHDVLDKYEVVSGVINEDVVSFSPKDKYDLIVSISTLEHVGWDETPREPKKFLRAIKNLRKITKRCGSIIFSVPFGQNKFLDRLIIGKKMPVDEIFYLRRVGFRAGWEETSLDKLKRTKSNLRIPRAEGIVICYMKNEK